MSAAVERIPVTLLTGFLGSGKTTLLARALRMEAFADTAVLVNEFGAVGLDHRLLRGATETRLLDNGCICCGVRGDLEAALADLYWDRLHRTVPRFCRVVIETTGLADPGPVLQVLEGTDIVAERYAWQGVVCTVDAVRGEQQLAARSEPNRQVVLADALVITKTDLAEASAVDRLEARLDPLNAIAPRMRVNHGEAPAALWEGLRHARPRQDGPSYARPTRSVPHDGDVHTFTVAMPRVGRAELLARLHALATRFAHVLLRVKGAVAVADAGLPMVVQVVQGSVHPLTALAHGATDGPRAGEEDAGPLVVILATGNGPGRGELEAAMRAILARPG